MRSRAAVESRVANGRDLRYLNNTVTITIENLPIVEVESTHKNSGSKGEKVYGTWLKRGGAKKKHREFYKRISAAFDSV